jgi:hypothetical protein
LIILKFKKAIDEITHFDSEPRFNRSNEINHHIFGSEEYLNSEIQNKYKELDFNKEFIHNHFALG